MRELKIFIKTNCGTCELIKNKVNRIRRDGFIDDIEIKFINVDKSEHREASKDIESVPTIILYSKEDIIWRHVGDIQYHAFRNNLEL